MDDRATLTRGPAASQGTLNLTIVPLDGKRAPFSLFAASGFSGTPEVSPDGKWLAYTLMDRGGFEVFVRPFASGGGTVQVSVGGGSNGIWTPDGRHLTYDHNGSFWNATLDVSGAIPRVARGDSLFPNAYINHAWTTDGRLAVVAGDGKGAKLIVVTNWLREARAKLGIQ
jgi:hypothetical protein